MFFPIIQGGRHTELRRASARFSIDLDTPGIAIAGESIGISPAISAETINSVRDLLPEEKPLYAMGLGGGPEGFLEAAACGMDMFDNTSPTRMARCGLALLHPEDGGTTTNKFRVNLKSGRFASRSKSHQRRLRLQGLPHVYPGLHPPPPQDRRAAGDAPHHLPQRLPDVRAGRSDPNLDPGGCVQRPETKVAFCLGHDSKPLLRGNASGRAPSIY